MITIADQLNQMRDTFNLWTQENWSTQSAFIVTDTVHLWKKLFDQSQMPKVLVMYNGEQIRGDFGIAAPLAHVDRRFLVAISRGRGFNLNRGDSFTEDVGNATAFADEIEELRDICRAMIFDPDWCEHPVDYLGIVPFNTADSGMITDAVQIEFSIGTQLGLIKPQPDQLLQTG